MEQKAKSKKAKTPKAVSKFIKGEYMNREYSWLQFNRRVLNQARDMTNPLLERCKFLSIFHSNLDEFFMVRVGSLYNENILDPKEKENKTDLTAAEQLDGILTCVKGLYAESSEVYEALRKELSEAGIRLLKGDKLTQRQSEECLK